MAGKKQEASLRASVGKNRDGDHTHAGSCHFLTFHRRSFASPNSIEEERHGRSAISGVARTIDRRNFFSKLVLHWHGRHFNRSDLRGRCLPLLEANPLSLPSSYYLEYLPVDLNAYSVVALAVLGSLVSIGAGIRPAFGASKFSVADALRYE